MERLRQICVRAMTGSAGSRGDCDHPEEAVNFGKMGARAGVTIPCAE
jgi:hypothetical protein